MREGSRKLGEWTIWPETGHMVHVDGRERQLQPKVMAVLQCLLQADGGLVTRQQLIDFAWDGRPTSDEPINRCIAELRAALDDDRRNPRYIRTVPKRGYCLLPDHGASQSSRPRQAVLLAGLLVALLALAMLFTAAPPPPQSPPRLLVLPVSLLSDEGGLELFAEALTEELIHGLAQQPQLTVISRTTSFSLPASGLTGRELAVRVDADYLVEGSLRLVDEQFRMTVQLIDTAADVHLFSRVFEQPVDRAADIPALVARAVAGQVGESLGDFATDSRSSQLPFPRYRDYIEAKRLLRIPESGGLSQAIERLERVVASAPEFAAGHAQLAAALYSRYQWERPEEPQLRRVDAQLRRALDLDPNNPLALVVRGQREPDLLLRESYFRQAVRMDPSSTDLQRELAGFLENYGYLKESRRIMARLVERDPLNPGHAHALVRLECSLGYYDRCEQRLQAASSLDWPGRSLEWFQLHLARGERAAATSALQDYLRASRTVTAADVELIVGAWFDPQLQDRAEIAIARIDSALPDRYKFWPALFWALAGKQQRSIATLVERQSHPWDERILPSLWSPAFAGLRADPGFERVGRRFGALRLWLRRTPDRCARDLDARPQLTCR